MSRGSEIDQLIVGSDRSPQMRLKQFNDDDDHQQSHYHDDGGDNNNDDDDDSDSDINIQGDTNQERSGARMHAAPDIFCRRPSKKLREIGKRPNADRILVPTSRRQETRHRDSTCQNDCIFRRESLIPVLLSSFRNVRENPHRVL